MAARRLPSAAQHQRALCSLHAAITLTGRIRSRPRAPTILRNSSTTTTTRLSLVSTQRRGDEAALPAALAVDSAYVAFIGSRKKADALKAALAQRGVPAERLAKLKVPAGLDLGAITPDGIAISILAEIVAVRRQSMRG